MKTKCFRIRIVKGFASGITCVARKVIQDGVVVYRCCPIHDFYVDYPADYIELV